MLIRFVYAKHVIHYKVELSNLPHKIKQLPLQLELYVYNEIMQLQMNLVLNVSKDHLNASCGNKKETGVLAQKLWV